MANGLVERASLQDIADAIREKNGTLNTYTPAEMGDAVRALGDNLPDLDLISFGEQSSLPEEGKTNPQYYEEIARAIRIRLSLNARLVVTSPVGSTLTVTGGGATQTTTSTGNDTFIIEVAGEYTVTATSGSDTASATVSITSYGQSESVTLTYFAAAINVTAPVGSTVTVALGGTTVDTHTGTGTAVAVVVHEAGTYDVTAAGDGQTASDTATITTSGQTESVTLEFIPDDINDASWELISEVSDSGEAANYWSVGDTKAVTLSGTVGACTFTNETYYAFIIGFDHNAALEGGNRIHFLFGKTALAGGTDVAFVDSAYNTPTTIAYCFHMNNGNTNSGGWNSSLMRNSICGTTLSSYSGTFIAALPSDLRSALKTVTKYTDNTGNSSTAAANVTATTDVIFLLAEWEVFGARTYANSAEQNKQAQYAYYAVGNSKVKYQHTATSTAAIWWLRSPYSGNAISFVIVYTSGSVNYNNTNYSDGFAPAFCV